MNEKQFSNHYYYDSVIRRIMWGENQSDVLASLKAKGMSNDEASQLVARAMRERASVIRSIFIPRIFWGLSLIVMGGFLTWVVWYLTEGYTVWGARAIILPALPVAAGLWMLQSGIIGCMMARTMTGPVSDIT